MKRIVAVFEVSDKKWETLCDTFDVEDKNGDVETFTSTEIGKKWYLIDDMVEVYDLHVDHQGIWVVFYE